MQQGEDSNNFADLSLTFNENETQSEMVEADQENFMELQPLDSGLDRVPTRLSSTGEFQFSIARWLLGKTGANIVVTKQLVYVNI